MRVLLKCYLHDAVVVRKDRLVAVAEVKAPYLDVLVRRAGDDELGVVRNVKSKNRKLRGYTSALALTATLGRAHFVSVKR